MKLARFIAAAAAYNMNYIYIYGEKLFFHSVLSFFQFQIISKLIARFQELFSTN